MTLTIDQTNFVFLIGNVESDDKVKKPIRQTIIKFYELRCVDYTETKAFK